MNERDGTAYSFARRGNEAPDLIYADGDRLKYIEVVGAYYDNQHATFLWKNARNVPDAPQKFSGQDFDTSLVENISRQIAAKCAKAYGRGCVLLVTVRPVLTTAEEMDELQKGITLPESVPFDAIFLSGNFAIRAPSLTSYRVWQLGPRIADE